MTGAEISVWAFSGGVHNFGDELGPAILTRLGYHVHRAGTIGEADLLASGSLIEAAAEQARPGTIVWGSGLMHQQPVDVSRLDVRAVRGRLTAAVLGVDVPTCDPGTLVPHLWVRHRQQHRTGVVRHYVDRRDYPWADVVVDASAPTDEVIGVIGSCQRVASSSLHGLIVAAAWGIPTMRLHHPDVAGGEFKWADWFTGDHDTASLLGCLP